MLASRPQVRREGRRRAKLNPDSPYKGKERRVGGATIRSNSASLLLDSHRWEGDLAEEVEEEKVMLVTTEI